MGLPKNWAVVNLEDISKISTGKKNANHANLEGEYEFFTCSINTSKSTTYSFEGPSVIVPGNGNIGYVFYYEDKFEAYQRTYVINEIKIFPKFLFYHFRCLWKKRTSDNLFGSTIQYVKIGHFKNYDINLPPLPEQERIVAKLDLLFGQIEKINEGIENLQNIKDKFQYSCLVDREKKSFYKREKIGQFLEEGTERIGETWNDCRLIGVSAKDGIIDLRTGQKKTFEKYKIVRKGDFIYNTMRVNIGSIAIYKGDEPAITSPDYVVFRTNNRLSSDLLLGFLKGEQGLLEIGANTKGSVSS